jgi:diadenosine tetraphosphate (Ap4A) HIT family hydrolase
MNSASCELCNSEGGEPLWRDDFCRVVLVNDIDYPGFCRVILNRHMQEMTDLSVAERDRLMTVVFAVEQVLREVAQPQKINLASLGNVVPHMHWHVIPRFADDKHYPNPIWGATKRDADKRTVDIANLRKKVIAALS